MKGWWVIGLVISAIQGQAQNLDLLGRLFYDDGLNDVWGYTDTAGHEYALVGVNTGVSIVDITTDSLNPTEVFKVPGPTSSWYDIKTWDGYAYATNEADSGLLVIDLHFLPDSIHYDWYSPQVDTFQYRSAHNIWIDEHGVAYLFGTNMLHRGTYFLDLTNDPYNPPVIGQYTDYYIHDGYVRGDTLWGSHIYEGFQSAIDVSDKQNPVVLGTVTTPNAFTHNCWLSNDGQTLFTTDERPGAYVTSYDVSDVTDMSEIDRYRANETSEIIPHNAYWLNDYVFVSYYRDGVILLDAKHPHNLVEVGRFDSSPFPSGPGYEGVWGAYPYFASGKVLISDRMEGLFVLRPQYQRGAYLEGAITDSANGRAIINAQIDIPLTHALEYSGLLGDFATGLPDPGVYTVRVSKPGCRTQYIGGVELFRDSVVTLNVELSCTPVTGIASSDNQMYIGQSGRTLRVQDQSNQPLHWELINLSGQRVFQKETTSYTSTLSIPSEISSGIYLLRVISEEVQYIQKIAIP